MDASRYTPIPDETLVALTLLGSFAAFDELVRRYWGAAVVVAEQVLGNRAAAEDAAQEAFLLAFKALPQLQQPPRFAAWLCTIARHRARRMACREGRSEPVEPNTLDRLIALNSTALAADPEGECLRRERDDCLAAALRRIPPDQRTVLALYYGEEWPVARIARFLSLPITTIKWRLHQGRERLRRAFAEEEIDDV